jgi:hypothetical protein
MKFDIFHFRLGFLDMVVMSCGTKGMEPNCGSDGRCACQTDLCNDMTLAMTRADTKILKCYSCLGKACTTELECPAEMDACIKTSSSKQCLHFPV